MIARRVAAAAAGVLVAACAQGAALISWESPPDSQGAQYDSAAGGYVNNTNVSTFTATGASDGAWAIQIGNDVAPGWKNLMKIFNGQINTELSAGPKTVSIDVTVNQVAPGDLWWNELVVVINSAAGGWDQSIAAVPIGAVNGTHTVTVTVPDQADGQPWMGLHFIWNSGPAASTALADIYVDNLRIDAVPEPTVLTGLAVSSLGLMIRRRQK